MSHLQLPLATVGGLARCDCGGDGVLTADVDASLGSQPVRGMESARLSSSEVALNWVPIPISDALSNFEEHVV